ncbi:MAG: hypothetical protein E8D51_02000 [Nitrospira sp.]|nr:MAG: hypothetical protein E8D51_02000 [Nitrospira sp.]
MAKKPTGSTKRTGLRRQAEALLRTTDRDVAAMPVKDVQQLVHELQVHQVSDSSPRKTAIIGSRRRFGIWWCLPSTTS